MNNSTQLQKLALTRVGVRSIKLNIYGHSAKVYYDGKRYIGRIDDLHVTDAAKSIRELENDLKNATAGLLEHALMQKKHTR